MDKINLTESELHRVIKDSVNKIVVKIGYRGVASTYEANHNDNYEINRNINVNYNMDKINRTQELNLPALSQAINDNFPNLMIQFRETIMGLWCTLLFSFSEITYIDKNRMVMKGDLSPAGKNFHHGYIEYNFPKDSFYEVHFYGRGSIRRIYKMIKETALPENEALTNKFLSFISNYLYSQEDYQTNVNNKPIK